MSDVIATDSEKLVSNSSVFISLYDLEFGGTTYYFHSQNTDDDIVFDGTTYSIFPMVLDGIELTGDGAQNRPSMTMANVNSLLSASAKSAAGFPADFVIEDLVGGRITRRQTLEKYTGVGVTAYEFPTDVYLIDRIASKNNMMIQLELASPFDFSGTRVPSRIVTGKYCPWVYKGYSTSATDVRSACYWQDESQITNTNGTFSFFFTIDDEPLIKETLTVITAAAAWVSATSYSIEDVVLYENDYYQSKTDTNQGNTPSEFSIFWKKIRTFSVWSTDTGSKQYTVDTTDPRKSSYVYHANTVWKALKEHTKDTNFAPGTAPTYWVAGDVCGKLLSSCKARYQAIETTGSGTGNNARPTVGSFNTAQVLPFGGFPGTRKFR
jgi:lambda family phage minor tail protein L